MIGPDCYELVVWQNVGIEELEDTVLGRFDGCYIAI